MCGWQSAALLLEVHCCTAGNEGKCLLWFACGSHRSVLIARFSSVLTVLGFVVRTPGKRVTKYRVAGRCRTGWAMPPGASTTPWCIGRQHSCRLPVNLTRASSVYLRCVHSLQLRCLGLPTQPSSRFPASMSANTCSGAPPSLARPPAVWLTQGPTSPQHLGIAGTSTRAMTAPCPSSLSALQAPPAPPSEARRIRCA